MLYNYSNKAPRWMFKYGMLTTEPLCLLSPQISYSNSPAQGHLDRCAQAGSKEVGR